MIPRYRSYVINVTLGAGASTPGTANIVIDVAKDFHVKYMTATSTGTFSARLRDNSKYSMYWFDQRIANTLLFGIAGLPFVLPVTRTLAAGAILYYELTDTSAAPNTIQLVLHGFEYIEEKELSAQMLTGEKLWRNYTLVNETVLASARIKRSVVIDQSPNFVATGILATSTSAAYQVQFYHSGDGQFRWSDALINSASIVGTAQYPFILPAPVYLNGENIMSVELLETSGVNNVIQLVLEGYEVQ